MRDPGPGEVIHSRTIVVTVPHYENEHMREATERTTRELFEEHTGLQVEDLRWRHEPATEHTAEDGAVFTLPEMWHCTVEAVGPIDLQSGP